MSEDDEVPAPDELAPEEVEPDGVEPDDEPEPIESELEPELIVPELPELELPGLVLEPPDVPERDEPAPEPAPEPMLPELVSPLEERLPLPELEPADFCHFWNSDCDSEPSLFASAVVKAPLSSVCIAASVCEMRPSRFASSELNEAVPDEPDELELAPEPWPIVLPLWRELLLPELPWLDDEPDDPPLWLCCMLPPELPAELPVPELLCPYAVAAITAAATALIIAAFFMIGPRMLMVVSTVPCWPSRPSWGMWRNSDTPRRRGRAAPRQGARTH